MKSRKEVEAIQTTNLRLPFGLIRLDKKCKHPRKRKVPYRAGDAIRYQRERKKHVEKIGR